MSVTSRDFWFGLLMGAAAGFIAAILTAPQPGSRTRENIVKSGIELKHKAEDITDQASAKAGELQQKASQTFDQELARATQVIQQESQRIQEVVNEVASKIPGRTEGQA